MKRIISIMAFMLLMVGNVSAALTWKNETLKYALYIGPIKAGEGRLITRNTTFEGQKVVRMDLLIRTTSAAEKIFSINDTITSYLDAKYLRPVYYRKHSFEGDNHYLERARYTYPATGGCRVAMHKTYRDGHVRENTENSSAPVYDLVSIMAYARSLNTSGFMAGKRIDYRFVDAADVIDECLIFEGRETVKVSGVKYDCLVFSFVEPYIEKGKTKYKEVLTLYMTDDEARTIVEMDIKYKVGSAKARLIK